MTTQRKIRVLVAKPGLDGHDRGAKVVARGLRDAGMEVIYTGLRQTPEMIAEVSLQEDVDVIGLSVLSGAHMVLLPAIVEKLHQLDMAHVLIVAGGIIPDEDIPALKKIGVAGIFTPGTSIQDIVTFIKKTSLENRPMSDSGLISKNRSIVGGAAGTNESPAPGTLAKQVLAGQRRAIARLITHLENEHPQAQSILSEIYPHTGQAHLIGITGAPGTGKSSLVNELAGTFRRQERTVAILAVDPTSPFSGGAILGDRIRMQDLVGDPGIFIRSMASRGNLGGLARATSDAIQVLDAAGFDVILIETVGAGQSEVEIAKTAQTIIVVEAPGLGDDIQAIKAGILEIADIFVVNKADRPGVNKTVAGLQAMLALGHAVPQRMMHHNSLLSVEGPSDQSKQPSKQIKAPAWTIPVIKTVALNGEGVEQVVEAIDHHWHHLAETGELAARNRARLTDELTNRLQVALMKQLSDQLPPGYLAEVMAKLVDRTLAPYNAVQEILALCG